MKASIVMPVFNGEKYIRYAIESVLNQSYDNIQFIIVDGGSTDSTMDIINEYKEHIELIISEKDNGMYDAINKGFNHSNGELMLWLNSDDYLFHNAIKTAVSIMKKHTNVKWMKGRNVYLDKYDNIRKVACLKSYYRSFISKGLYQGRGFGFIMQETTFWHRSLYELAGNFINTDYRLASDFELWYRFSKYETLYSVNSLFGAFRQHDSQLSNDNKRYEMECDKICKVPMKSSLLFIKYPLYIYAMLDSKNKISFDRFGESNFIKYIGQFQ